MRLGLLLVGHVAATSTHIAGDYPELFSGLLGPDVELVRYDLDQDRFPDSGRECDGWLLSPSRCSVYDAHAWIASAEDLLRTFWESHDPTQGYRQGNDVGTTYRSAVYTTTPEQELAARSTRDEFQPRLTQSGFGAITTEIRSADDAGPFYYAEGYHQQYLDKNPAGYCGLGGTGVSCPRPTGA